MYKESEILANISKKALYIIHKFYKNYFLYKIFKFERD